MPSNMTLSSITAILILSTDDRTRILTKYYTPPHSSGPSGGGSYPSSGGVSSSTSSSSATPYGSLKEQKAFEKGLLDKTNKQSGDVILYDGKVVVYKMEGDVMLYVVGGGDENEILLFGVVLALRDSLAILLKFDPPPPLLTAFFPSFPSFHTSLSTLIYYPPTQTKPPPRARRNSTDKRTLIENYDLVSLAVDEIVDDGIILEVDPVVVASRVTRPPQQDVVGVKGIDLSEQGLVNAWELFKQKGVERMRQF